MEQDKPEPDVMGVRDLDRLYRAQSELHKMKGDDLTPELEEDVEEISGKLGQLMMDVGIEMYHSSEDNQQDK